MKVNNKFPKKKLKMSKSIHVDLEKYGDSNIRRYKEIERQSYCYEIKKMIRKEDMMARKKMF